MTSPGVGDFLPADLAAVMARDAAALSGDLDAGSQTVTYRYHAAAPSSHDPYAGTADLGGTTESVSAILGSLRDSQSGETMVGRYWMLAPVSGFTAATPDTQDVVVDEDGLALIVNAVRRDPLGLLYRFDLTRTELAP